jgi:hypothetical protein
MSPVFLEQLFRVIILTFCAGGMSFAMYSSFKSNELLTALWSVFPCLFLWGVSIYNTYLLRIMWVHKGKND